MAWRLVVRQFGGPDVIEREDFDPPSPRPGQVLIETEAIGLNLIDTYYRKGLYPAPLPLALGSESAGRVVAVGEGVSDLAVGDRVGCVTGAGAYATHRVIPAAQAIRLEPDIAFETAAALMLKGFTSCFLAEDIIDLKPGQSALVHSAAGGVGSILVPWLRSMGVKVIAHVGSAAKAALVDSDHVLSCPFSELAEEVRSLTDGQGVDAVFDGVGQDSWNASLASVRRRGMLVSYGNASGPVPPILLLDLMRAGSVFVTRPTLFDYIAAPGELQNCARRLFDRIRQGVVKPTIGQRFALVDAAEAHRAIEARETTGSTVLIP